MPKAQTIQKFDAVEGKFLKALGELRNALIELGETASPIISISLSSETYNKVGEHVRQHCSNWDSNNTEDPAQDAIVWSDIKFMNATPLPYRESYDFICGIDIQSGIYRDPSKSTYYRGRRILKCEPRPLEAHHLSQGQTVPDYELKVAQPRSYYIDDLVDMLPENNDVEVSRPVSRNIPTGIGSTRGGRSVRDDTPNASQPTQLVGEWTPNPRVARYDPEPTPMPIVFPSRQNQGLDDYVEYNNGDIAVGDVVLNRRTAHQRLTDQYTRIRELYANVAAGAPQPVADPVPGLNSSGN